MPSSALSSSWQVELDLFQGPLPALLDLIERRELPVTRVSLVAVTDQYLALVRSMPSLDLDVTAEFLHVAARLLLLKSLAVQPRTVEDEPREEDAEDEDDLEARLLLYRRYRDGARLLAARQESDVRTFGRIAAPESMERDRRIVAPAPASLDPRRLYRAAQRAAARASERDRAASGAPAPLIPFTQVLHALVGRLHGRGRTTFHEVAAEAADTVMAITMFLAVLELVRRQQLTIHQDGRFGPISLEPTPELERRHGVLEQ